MNGVLMCNNKGGIAESSIDQQHSHVFPMDGRGSPPASEDSPRVKFLCSFSGSILPRPQDGKLRYVGGETRIVSVGRDIGFEELMGKMRELYDGTAAIKYQQPDEDLDALVSVVNDEDVVNMMEEYDKLGSGGDGFTRLRIFLFSQPENYDVSSQHYDGDERETERRYVDALNNLNDGPPPPPPDFRRQFGLDSSSPVMGPVDDLHAAAEQYFGSLSLESGVHGGIGPQRSYEMALPMYNLRHLSIPHVGSAQHIPVETPWSPAYYSPRPVAEFPSSPSSARFHVPFGELPMPEEYPRQQLNQQQAAFDHQPHYSESSVAWQPGDKSAFPGNIFHGHSGVEGSGISGICEHCRIAFHRNFEHPSVGNNGLHQVPNPSVDSLPNRESLILSGDAKTHSHHGFYPNNEQSSDHRSLYNEAALTHERGWILQQQQLNPRADETRCGSGRMNDHYLIDSAGHGNMMEGRHFPANYLHQRAGHEVGNEVFHEQTVVGTPHIHVPSPEESGARYGNLPYPFVGESGYPTHVHVVPGHPLWRNAQNQPHLGHPYEPCNSVTQVGGKIHPGLPRGQWEGSSRGCVGLDNPNPSVESSKIYPFEGKATLDYTCGHASRINSTTQVQENRQPFFPDPIRVSPSMVKCDSGAEPDREPVRSDETNVIEDEKEVNQAEKSKPSDAQDIVHSLELKTIGDNNGEVLSPGSLNSSCIKLADESADVVKPGVKEHSAPEVIHSADKQSVLLDITFANKDTLDEANYMEVKVEEDIDVQKNGSIAQDVSPNELKSVSARADMELDSDSDNINTSRIEPTKAEAEAIDKGLQAIKNDDLEEIRELGSGTYGAVYYGKWRGSDVAIKRIKASCFAGRPSERERLIADFWKEASILGSLHHPNVVSFYGIVRDGPDGSLATVTEFMVNGSLKQFLQKKDRTIDRRKRLIIAMDAAFGMEYLHGKNIVHFDLKCENLLVNMRDPQRPVCKIGDLGLSKVKQHTLVSGGVRGTLPWMAPELLSGKSNMVTEKIDVYSFGIVMWELLTGEEPYADMHCASIIGGIVNNTLRPQSPTWCDPEWKSLMESCWASDPSQRPSFSEISQKLRNMAAAMNLK